MDKGDGLTMSFQDVQNYVVRLSSKPHQKNNSAILLNCHVDTVPLSPGASDDAVNCGIMLDVLFCSCCITYLENKIM